MAKMPDSSYALFVRKQDFILRCSTTSVAYVVFRTIEFRDTNYIGKMSEQPHHTRTLH